MLTWHDVSQTWFMVFHRGVVFSLLCCYSYDTSLPLLYHTQQQPTSSSMSRAPSLSATEDPNFEKYILNADDHSFYGKQRLMQL